MSLKRVNQAELIESSGNTQAFLEGGFSSEELRGLLSQIGIHAAADHNRPFDIANTIFLPYLAHAPGALDTFQQAQRYCDHYPDFGLFEHMETMNHHEFIAFIHQKSFTKAYFIKFLQIIEEGAKQNNKSELLKMIQWNLQDETGIYYGLPIQGFENAIIPLGGTIAHYLPLNEDTYGTQAHSAMRVDMLEGYNNCYHETITRLGEEHYNFINPHITKELRNNGTGLFNAGVELAIKTWQRLEVLGAMIFLEMSIPVEFINMTKKARDRLFPDMNPKARFYEDFHIKHDIDRHTAGLIEGFHDAHFSNEEIDLIKKGMYHMMVLKGIFYKGFVEQLSVKKPV